MIALMDALKIEKAIIAGCDWGARTANIIAALWPERCKAMVSVSGYLIGTDPSSYAKKFSGKYAHRSITGGIGHNLPQEAPNAFAEACRRGGQLRFLTRLAGCAAAPATRLVPIFCSIDNNRAGRATLVNHNAIQNFVAGVRLADGQESIAEVVTTEPSRSGNRAIAPPENIKVGLTVNGVYRQLSLATWTILRLMHCARISP